MFSKKWSKQGAKNLAEENTLTVSHQTKPHILRLFLYYPAWLEIIMVFPHPTNWNSNRIMMK